MKKSNKILFVFNLIFFLFVSFSCSNAEKEQIEKDLLFRANAKETYLAIQQDKLKKEQAIFSFVENLSLNERISQLFLVNLEGNKKFTPVEFYDDGKPMVPGGYLFFSYNVADTAEDVANFTASIGSFCKENQIIPPLLGIDQEGGLVNRLRKVTSALPSAKLIAERLSPSQAEEYYETQGKQMSAMGFHLNLAPVAEALDQGNSAFLDTRSYGDSETVEKYAESAVTGYKNGNILAVLKHFPGNTNDDPHTGLPEIKLSEKDLENNYLKPFQNLLESKPAGVLMSHARTSAFDSQKPACLSEYWVTKVLRNKYNYEGLIFSDDIFMAALEKNGFPPDVAVVMAIEAGIDVIMLSEKRFGSALNVLGKIAESDENFANKIFQSVCRIVKAKIDAGILSIERNGEGYIVKLNTNDNIIFDEVFDEANQQGKILYQKYFGGKS